MEKKKTLLKHYKSRALEQGQGREPGNKESLTLSPSTRMVAHILHPPSPVVSAVPLHPPTHTLGQGSHVPVTMLLYSELLMHVLTGEREKKRNTFY